MKRLPFWLFPPPAITTLTTETIAPRHAVCALCCVSPACIASFTLREAWFTSHTARFLSVSLSLSPSYNFRFLFLSSFWCWPAACAASCQQGGGSTRTHFLCFLCFLFFSLHTPLSFERESSETILLFSDSGGSEVGQCEDGTRSR